MDKATTIHDKLHVVQTTIVCPKKRTNKFAGYQYRNCEDLIEAAKKVLPAGCTLGISDEIVMLGERFYVKATASFSYNGHALEKSGFAREPLAKKGQDEPQITGTASSYARKLALGGLLMIDDGVDADQTNKHDHDNPALAELEQLMRTSTEHNNYVLGVLDKKRMGLRDLSLEQAGALIKAIKGREANG